MDNAETYKTEELISFPQIAVEANSPSFFTLDCDILFYLNLIILNETEQFF